MAEVDKQRGNAKRSQSEEPQALGSVRLIRHYEILTAIFAYFVPHGRKQLHDLALACKAFSEPALDCLWANLDSLKPLLRLHPALRIVNNFYYFLGDIDDSAAHRFHRYARRVRAILLEEGGNEGAPPLSHAGFSWLGQQLRGSPLMPGLKRIRFCDPNRDSVNMGLLPLLLSPSIQDVSFEGMFLSADTFSSYALPLVCQGAKAMLHLSMENHSFVTDAGIWDCLPAIAVKLQLHTLKIAFPDNLTLKPNLLGTLGRTFDTLTSLSLDVHTPSHGPSGDVMETGILPLLINLHLVNRCEANLCQCYPAFLLQRATSIKFHSWNHILDANAFSDSINTLSQCKRLRAVEITALIHGQWHVIVPPALLPFLHQLNLEEFIVDGEDLEVDLGGGGNEIQSLIDAAFGEGRKDRGRPLQRLTVPLLRLRPLGNNGERDGGEFPPIKTLVYIAQHAHGLKEITLPIDSSVVGEGESLQSLLGSWEKPDSPSTLQHLNIADRRSAGQEFTPAEYRDLARLLDTIFPHLQALKPIDFPELSVKVQWKANWELVEEHRRMRKALRILGMAGGY